MPNARETAHVIKPRVLPPAPYLATPPGRRTRTASERIRHVQVAGDAPAFTGIAPYAEAEAQGGAGDGLRLSPVAHAGVASQVRGVDGVAVGYGPRLAVEFASPRRPGMGGDGAVPRAGEAPADAQAANV